MILAQATATNVDWISELLQGGIAGGVLVWFMLVTTPRLKAIEQSIDRMVRSVLLLIVTYGNKVQQEQAKAIEAEVDAAERERTK